MNISIEKRELRKIIREEVKKALEEILYDEIEVGSPIWDDLQKLKKRYKKGKVKFYSYEEIFGEPGKV
jgi:uncharacterized protein YajQ (UPF0234 family)